MSSFIWVDILIIGFLLLTALISYNRGGFKTVFSIISWFAAFYLATNFFSNFNHHFEVFSDDIIVRNWISRAAIFALVLLIGAVVSNIINHLFIINSASQGINKLLGIIIGVFLGLLIILLILLLISLTGFINHSAFSNSKLLPYLLDLANGLKPWLPDIFLNNFEFDQKSIPSAGT